MTVPTMLNTSTLRPESRVLWCGATVLMIGLFLGLGCEKDTQTQGATHQPAQPEEARLWAAELVAVEAFDEARLEVRMPGTSEFGPLRQRQPVPSGAVVRTPPNARATFDLGDGRVTLNRSTEVEVAVDHVLVKSGQVVLEYVGGETYTVGLPTGNAIIRGDERLHRVAVFAGGDESSIAVASGTVEVGHQTDAARLGAGQEAVLFDSAPPIVAPAGDLARRFDWAELNADEEGQDFVPRGIGRLVGKTIRGDNETELILDEHRINVKVQGNVAYTEVTEVFRNPTSKELGGVYRFPLPHAAEVRRLAVRSGDKVFDVDLREVEQSSTSWKTLPREWEGSSRFKWRLGDVFEVQIYPINPKQEREIVVGYTQPLDTAARGYTYVYPMPVDSARTSMIRNFSFQAELYGHDATQHVDVIGYPMKVERGEKVADSPVTRVSFSEKDFFSAGEVMIRFNRGDAVGLHTYEYVDDGGDGFAVFTVRPDVVAPADKQRRDFVIVVDTSLNQTGAPLAAQLRLAQHLVRAMDSRDRVVVVGCSHVCKPLGSATFKSATSAVADEVRVKSLNMEAAGASYPVEAVRVAAELFQQRDDKGSAPHIIWMTDGEVSAGESRPGPLTDAVRRVLEPVAPQTTIVNFGDGTHIEQLEALARGSNGTVTIPDHTLTPSGRALDILVGHYGAFLTNPAVELPRGMVLDTTPPVGLVAGRELVIAARFDGQPEGELALTGAINGVPFAQRYPVALRRRAAIENSFVPREWATHRIRALERSRGEAARDEIVGLSKTYGVLSRYTELRVPNQGRAKSEFIVPELRQARFDGYEFVDDQLSEEPDAEQPTVATAAQQRAMEKRMAELRAEREKNKGKKKKQKESAPAAPLGMPMGLPFMGNVDSDTAAVVRETMPEMDYDGPFSQQMQGMMGAPAQPGARRPKRRKWVPPKVVHRKGKDATKWEADNVKKRAEAHKLDPGDRAKRMQLVRAQLRARMFKEARKEIDDWLEIYPLDPEAHFLRAQYEAIGADIDDAIEAMLDAAESAPRSSWVIQRVYQAAQADGNVALSCAYRFALESLASPDAKKAGDVLGCPMTTDVAGWQKAAEEPSEESDDEEWQKTPNVRAPKGEIVLSLDTHGNSDWDLALIEPSGRLLWWGSQREDVQVVGVRGDGVEYLALPRRQKRGTYSVVVIPRGSAEPTSLTVEVTVDGDTKQYSESVRSTTEIAEIQFH